MIAELGHFALALALVLAAAQAILPLAGLRRHDPVLMCTGATSAQAQLVFVALAFIALAWAYASSDFSVASVAAHSHSAKPLLYKLTGVWGNHEGSMLLWVFILALFGACVATFGANLPGRLKAAVLSVQGMIGAAFLLFILLTSNPFLRLDPAPFDGQDLNPILQDPALAFHPPFLYLGYVGFSIAFSFAIAALIEGRVDAAWARWVRPWTLAAWMFLTIGIAMGSWWAYYELGWGGWWFWDPVENASLMPWLAGTALLHSAIVVERRESLKSWTIFLAILTFGLSLIGTFLVRSGVLTSVHAFASSPTRGVFILAILLAVIGGSLALYAARAGALRPRGTFAPLRRESALLVNNLILACAAATVFLGTLYPLVLDALGGDKISVGPPYFNMTFVPLMLPLLLLVPVGPFLTWKRADPQALWTRCRPLVPTVLAGTALSLALQDWRYVWAALGMGLVLWLVLGAVFEVAYRIRLFRAPFAECARRARQLPRATYGMALAHGGLGVLVAGIMGMSAWQAETIAVMSPGEAVTLSGNRYVLDKLTEEKGPNYRAARGHFRVERDGRTLAELYPEKRHYPVRNSNTSEAAIHSNGFRDWYVVLGERQESGAWTVRIYDNPLAPWIWAGAVIMALGGAVSLSDRRLRVGVPARRRQRA